MKKTLSVEGSAIHYRVLGSGGTVILVHGFGETGAVWDRQAAYFENKYRLIIPDLPGSGSSELIADMSMSGMAEIVKKIAEQEAVPGEKPVLIGHSMGGYIALAYAEKYANELSGFGLFHSTAYADNDEKKATRRKGIEFIREHGAFAFLKNTSPKLFSEHTKKENPDLVEGFIQSLSNFSPEALVSYYEGMIDRPDRTAVLEKSPWPVLFIAGEHDTAIPLEDILKLCRIPEKSYIHTLSKSGHLGMLEETDRSNQILEEYLAELNHL